MAIDAARGTAIVLMCISHVGDLVDTARPFWGSLFYGIGLTATPTFLLLSGLATGIVLSRESAQSGRIRLIDRGIFVLLAAHVAIALCHSRDYDSLWTAPPEVYITDAV